jgi:hypothetical protein
VTIHENQDDDSYDAETPMNLFLTNNHEQKGDKVTKVLIVF